MRMREEIEYASTKYDSLYHLAARFIDLTSDQRRYAVTRSAVTVMRAVIVQTRVLSIAAISRACHMRRSPFNSI